MEVNYEMMLYFILYLDAINHFDGGQRSTYGENATAGIFATYPQDYVSTLNCFVDQVGCYFTVLFVWIMFSSR